MREAMRIFSLCFRRCLSGFLVAFFWAVLGCAHTQTSVASDTEFQSWIHSFRAEALQQGVRADIYDQAFLDVKTPDGLALEKAHYQPEFRTEAWEYMDNRVQERAIQTGRAMQKQYAKTLQSIERSTGVDSTVLLAIWSMESAYGAALKKPDELHYIPQALATLAYADQPRAKYARTQLIAALKILQRGDVAQNDLRGSWAGAMGHTQFIPTSYLTYAVDADGDGKSDIWHSVPDALATAAQLLKKNGWRSGERWGYEVLNVNAAQNGKWLALQGDQGPVFAVQKNFSVIKRYNNADKYALAVLLLADRIAGKPALQRDWVRPYTPLTMSEKEALQRLLVQKGFYSGVIDGLIGDESRKAIIRFQSSRGLAQTGYPSKDMLLALQRAH